jgi:hypothetical protein
MTTPRSILEGLAGELAAVEFADPFWFRGDHPDPRPRLLVLGRIGQPIDDDGFSVIALDFVEDGDGLSHVQEGQFIFYGLVRKLILLRAKRVVAITIEEAK